MYEEFFYSDKKRVENEGLVMKGLMEGTTKT
jgi:hypothetical protein